MSLGVQWVVDCYGCDATTLDDPKRIGAALDAVVTAIGVTVLERRIHRFTPQGVSGFFLLAQSHLAIHTWPERGYAAIDLFTCGVDPQPEEAWRDFAAAAGASNVNWTRIERG